jgi:hypothetical protein
MRVGGPNILNQASSFPLTLPGGGFCYLPMGNYLTLLGTNTVLQWWDPVGALWRDITGVTSSTQAISVDGYNYRLLNTTSTTGVATVTGAGSGATNGIGQQATGVTVTAQAAPAGGRTARYFAIVGGSLPALNVAQGGSGFLVPPLILIDPPPYGGIQATAVCTISAGAVATATLVNVGAGYTALPNVYVIPQFLDYPGAPSLITGAIPPNFPPGFIAGGAGQSGGGTLPPQNWRYGLQIATPITSGALINFGAGAIGGSGTVTGITLVDGGLGYTAAATTLTVTGAGAATATIANPVAAANDTSFIQASINE